MIIILCLPWHILPLICYIRSKCSDSTARCQLTLPTNTNQTNVKKRKYRDHYNHIAFQFIENTVALIKCYFWRTPCKQQPKTLSSCNLKTNKLILKNTHTQIIKLLHIRHGLESENIISLIFKYRFLPKLIMKCNLIFVNKCLSP